MPYGLIDNKATTLRCQLNDLMNNNRLNLINVDPQIFINSRATTLSRQTPKVLYTVLYTVFKLLHQAIKSKVYK